MKKLIAFFTCLIISVSFAFSVSAAGINTAEQAIIDWVSKEFSINGVANKYKIPAKNINELTNYFMTVEVTDTQKTQVIAKMQEIIDVVNQASRSAAADESGNLRLGFLPASVKSDMVKLGSQAAQILGLKFVVSYGAQKQVIASVVGPDGAVLISSEIVVKNTGFDSSSPMFIALGSVLVLAAVLTATIAWSKKKA